MCTSKDDISFQELKTLRVCLPKENTPLHRGKLALIYQDPTQGYPLEEASGLYIIERRSANYVWQSKSGLPPVFINKVLLEHSHPQSFMYCIICGCFHDER